MKRPFAEQARRQCVQSGHHDSDAWFCMTCNLIERRLTPIFDLETQRALLQEANLELSIEIGDLLDRLGSRS